MIFRVDIEKVTFILYFLLKCKFCTNNRWICSRAIFTKTFHIFLPKQEHFCSALTFLKIRKLKKSFRQTLIKYLKAFLSFSIIFSHLKVNIYKLTHNILNVSENLKIECMHSLVLSLLSKNKTFCISSRTLNKISY